MSDNVLTLEEAQTLLNGCIREELVDHTFGDAEVFWWDANKARDEPGAEVASAYYSSSHRSVSIRNGRGNFQDDDAQTLRRCGRLGGVERNDVNGTVPGIVLTLNKD